MEFTRANWDSFDFRREVDEKIGLTCGWVPLESNPLVWWDVQANRAAPFSRGGPGLKWLPSDYPELALKAAEIVSRRRAARFSLSFSDGLWRASFDLRRSGASGVQRDPHIATCEAIVRIGDVPDPAKLFE